MLLAEYDPMNLMFEDMPYNEYDREVDEILLRLDEISSPDVFGQVIYEIFVGCFGVTFAVPGKSPSESTKEQFASIGNIAWHIWEYWQEEVQKKRASLL